MIANLFVNNIITGNLTFADVPRRLRDETARILINDYNMPKLVPDEYKVSV